MDIIQELFFENKEKIPEGLYIKVMDSLKKEFDKQKTTAFKIHYIIIKPELNKYRNKIEVSVNKNIEIHKKTLFLNYEEFEELDDEEYNSLIKQLTKTPFEPFYAPFDMFSECMDPNFGNFLINLYIKDNNITYQENSESIKREHVLNYNSFNNYLIINAEKIVF